MENWAYEDVLAFTRSWDAVYFTLMFAAALAYALWPSNRSRFDRAARIPLNDDGDAL
ncbi:MAG TPA: cbb3-type cytochrome c oxidase subunit 3 [Rhizomicrobium sp.]|nr:cbb3-type cytochrome c oxidase subunit 3 [Rhizomicrobium sp.]